MIQDFVSRGISGSDPLSRTTLRLTYDGEVPEEVPQLDDRGIDEALRILTDGGVCRPVARLRPLGVLH
jgi:hypothetical protein